MLSCRSFRPIRLIILLFIAMATLKMAAAQDVKVEGHFLRDSVRLGEPIAYVMTARYPETYTVLFPDSTFSFKPFDFEVKKIFPTITVHGISRDSVIYLLTTYEIDNVQSLSLPVFRIVGPDSVGYITKDSVLFKSLVVKLPPDSVETSRLPLKTDTRYTKVAIDFNYLLASIVVGGIVILLIAGWILFGKKIRRHYRIRRLTREHKTFLFGYNHRLEALQRAPSREATETTLLQWKKYMEQLNRKPYTRLTSRETMLMENNHEVGEVLKSVDRAIYGNETAVIRPLEQLRAYAEKNYLRKLNELLNG